MSRKIIGVTVGTPMRPQALIEKTEQAEKVKDNTEKIAELEKETVKSVNGKKGNVKITNKDVSSPSHIKASSVDSLIEKIGTAVDWYTNTCYLGKSCLSELGISGYDAVGLVNKFAPYQIGLQFTYEDNNGERKFVYGELFTQDKTFTYKEVGTGSGTGAVDSVNGKTGAVKLTAEDVGARPSTWTPTAEDVGARSDTWMPTAEEVGAATQSYVDGEIGERFVTVTSVNEIIGSVSNQKTITCFLDNDCLEELGLSDTEAMYGFGLAVRKSPGSILLQFAINGTRFIYGELTTGTKTFEFEEVYSQTELDAKFTALNNKYQPKGNYLTDAPVKSVNGKTGAVTLSATDVGAATSEEVSSLKSDLDKKVDEADLESEVANQLDGAKADIVAELVAQIGGMPVFGTVDDNNTITVTSALSDGVYSLMYENDDGILVEIGTITVGNGEVVDYTNLAKPTDENWKNGYRFSSSGEAEQTGTTISNYIPCKEGDVIRIKGVTLRQGADRVAVYRTQAGSEYINYTYWNQADSYVSCELVDDVYVCTILENANGEAHSFRFAMPTPTDASQVIVTVNEEI